MPAMRAEAPSNAEPATAELASRPSRTPPGSSRPDGPDPGVPFLPEEGRGVLLSIQGSPATYPIRGQLLWLGMQWVPSSHVWVGIIPAPCAKRLLSEHPLQVIGKVAVEPEPTPDDAARVAEEEEAEAPRDEASCPFRCLRCGNHTLTLAHQEGQPDRSSCRDCDPAPLATGPRQPDWDLTWKEERERQREHAALVAEWDRDYPGWRFPTVRRKI